MNRLNSWKSTSRVLAANLNLTTDFECSTIFNSQEVTNDEIYKAIK